MSIMKRWITLFSLLLMAGLAFWQVPAKAQPRLYNQAELDALLAPIALYPDSVLSHVLVAATRPQDLQDAAAWSRANPHLSGEAAVQAADTMPWHPSVKALVAFPDLLARMDESPQWTADLASAFIEQEPHVMDTVQALRRRAQASGALQSNPQYSVQQEGSSIAVYPAHPDVVYVPYYDPYVVYGPWWWPAYRPVFWQPWHARPAFFGHAHFVGRHVDWHRRHVVRHHGGYHQPRAIRDVHTPFREQRIPVRVKEPQRRSHPPTAIQPHPHPRAIVGNPVSLPSHTGSSVRPIVDSVRIHSQTLQPRVHAQPQLRGPKAHLAPPQQQKRFESRGEHRGHHNRRG